MKKKKFYRFLLNEKGGVLYAPKGTDTRFGAEVLPVENWQHIEFTLQDGEYLPFMNSNVMAIFVNEDLKKLIDEIVPEEYPLEFLPIKVKSEEYGDRTYYLIHFKIVFDVIDEVNSVRIPSTKSIAIPYIDYNKAKDLDFFNHTARFNDIIVSDKMKKLMKQRNLDTGIDFVKIHYI